jgi:hypothetical protein
MNKRGKLLAGTAKGEAAPFINHVTTKKDSEVMQDSLRDVPHLTFKCCFRAVKTVLMLICDGI